MRVAELKALMRECGLRGYSRLRKAELIALLQNNPPPPPLEGHSVPPPPPPAPRTRPQDQLGALSPRSVEGSSPTSANCWVGLHQWGPCGTSTASPKGPTTAERGTASRSTNWLGLDQIG